MTRQYYTGLERLEYSRRYSNGMIPQASHQRYMAAGTALPIREQQQERYPTVVQTQHGAQPIDLDGSVSSQPRRRIAVACSRCRRRKIKCSGDLGDGSGCQNCKNSGADPESCQFLRVNSQNAEDIIMSPYVATRPSSAIRTSNFSMAALGGPSSAIYGLSPSSALAYSRGMPPQGYVNPSYQSLPTVNGNLMYSPNNYGPAYNQSNMDPYNLSSVSYSAPEASNNSLTVYGPQESFRNGPNLSQPPRSISGQMFVEPEPSTSGPAASIPFSASMVDRNQGIGSELPTNFSVLNSSTPGLQQASSVNERVLPTPAGLKMSVGNNSSQTLNDPLQWSGVASKSSDPWSSDGTTGTLTPSTTISSSSSTAFTAASKQDGLLPQDSSSTHSSLTISSESSSSISCSTPFAMPGLPALTRPYQPHPPASSQGCTSSHDVLLPASTSSSGSYGSFLSDKSSRRGSSSTHTPGPESTILSSQQQQHGQGRPLSSHSSTSTQSERRESSDSRQVTHMPSISALSAPVGY